MPPALEIPGSRQLVCAGFVKTFSAHPAGNGHRALFRAEEGKGDEKEE